MNSPLHCATHPSPRQEFLPEVFVPDLPEPSPEKDRDRPALPAHRVLRAGGGARPRRPVTVSAAVRGVPASMPNTDSARKPQAAIAIPILQKRKQVSGGVKSLAPDRKAIVEAQLEAHLAPKLVGSEHGFLRLLVLKPCFDQIMAPYPSNPLIHSPTAPSFTACPLGPGPMPGAGATDVNEPHTHPPPRSSAWPPLLPQYHVHTV